MSDMNRHAKSVDTNFGTLPFNVHSEQTNTCAPTCSTSTLNISRKVQDDYAKKDHLWKRFLLTAEMRHEMQLYSKAIL